MSAYSSPDHLPSLITVSQLVQSRYQDGVRPASWDQRTEGADVVRDTNGRQFKLLSDGGQSPPKSGWSIMLTDGSVDHGYHWTLYGMPQGVELP